MGKPNQRNAGRVMGKWGRLKKRKVLPLVYSSDSDSSNISTRSIPSMTLRSSNDNCKEDGYSDSRSKTVDNDQSTLMPAKHLRLGSLATESQSSYCESVGATRRTSLCLTTELSSEVMEDKLSSPGQLISPMGALMLKGRTLKKRKRVTSQNYDSDSSTISNSSTKSSVRIAQSLVKDDQNGGSTKATSVKVRIRGVRRKQSTDLGPPAKKNKLINTSYNDEGSSKVSPQSPGEKWAVLRQKKTRIAAASYLNNNSNSTTDSISRSNASPGIVRDQESPEPKGPETLSRSKQSAKSKSNEKKIKSSKSGGVKERQSADVLSSKRITAKKNKVFKNIYAGKKSSKTWCRQSSKIKRAGLRRTAPVSYVNDSNSSIDSDVCLNDSSDDFQGRRSQKTCPNPLEAPDNINSSPTERQCKKKFSKLTQVKAGTTQLYNIYSLKDAAMAVSNAEDKLLESPPYTGATTDVIVLAEDGGIKSILAETAVSKDRSKEGEVVQWSGTCSNDSSNIVPTKNDNNMLEDMLNNIKSNPLLLKQLFERALNDASLVNVIENCPEIGKNVDKTTKYITPAGENSCMNDEVDSSELRKKTYSENTSEYSLERRSSDTSLEDSHLEEKKIVGAPSNAKKIMLNLKKISKHKYTSVTRLVETNDGQQNVDIDEKQKNVSDKEGSNERNCYPADVKLDQSSRNDDGKVESTLDGQILDGRKSGKVKCKEETNDALKPNTNCIRNEKRITKTKAKEHTQGSPQEQKIIDSNAFHIIKDKTKKNLRKTSLDDQQKKLSVSSKESTDNTFKKDLAESSKEIGVPSKLKEVKKVRVLENGVKLKNTNSNVAPDKVLTLEKKNGNCDRISNDKYSTDDGSSERGTNLKNTIQENCKHENESIKKDLKKNVQIKQDIQEAQSNTDIIHAPELNALATYQGSSSVLEKNKSNGGSLKYDLTPSVLETLLRQGNLNTEHGKRELDCKREFKIVRLKNRHQNYLRVVGKSVHVLETEKIDFVPDPEYVLFEKEYTAVASEIFNDGKDEKLNCKKTVMGNENCEPYSRNVKPFGGTKEESLPKYKLDLNIPNKAETDKTNDLIIPDVSTKECEKNCVPVNSGGHKRGSPIRFPGYNSPELQKSIEKTNPPLYRGGEQCTKNEARTDLNADRQGNQKLLTKAAQKQFESSTCKKNAKPVCNRNDKWLAVKKSPGKSVTGNDDGVQTVLLVKDTLSQTDDTKNDTPTNYKSIHGNSPSKNKNRTSNSVESVNEKPAKLKSVVSIQKLQGDINSPSTSEPSKGDSSNFKASPSKSVRTKKETLTHDTVIDEAVGPPCSSAVHESPPPCSVKNLTHSDSPSLECNRTNAKTKVIELGTKQSQIFGNFSMTNWNCLQKLMAGPSTRVSCSDALVHSEETGPEKCEEVFIGKNSALLQCSVKKIDKNTAEKNALTEESVFQVECSEKIILGKGGSSSRSCKAFAITEKTQDAIYRVKNWLFKADEEECRLQTSNINQFTDLQSPVTNKSPVCSYASDRAHILDSNLMSKKDEMKIEQPNLAAGERKSNVLSGMSSNREDVEIGFGSNSAKENKRQPSKETIEVSSSNRETRKRSSLKRSKITESSLKNESCIRMDDGETVENPAEVTKEEEESRVPSQGSDASDRIIKAWKKRQLNKSTTRTNYISYKDCNNPSNAGNCRSVMEDYTDEISLCAMESDLCPRVTGFGLLQNDVVCIEKVTQDDGQRVWGIQLPPVNVFNGGGKTSDAFYQQFRKIFIDVSLIPPEIESYFASLTSFLSDKSKDLLRSYCLQYLTTEECSRRKCKLKHEVDLCFLRLLDPDDIWPLTTVLFTNSPKLSRKFLIVLLIWAQSTNKVLELYTICVYVLTIDPMDSDYLFEVLEFSSDVLLMSGVNIKEFVANVATIIAEQVDDFQKGAQIITNFMIGVGLFSGRFTDLFDILLHLLNLDSVSLPAEFINLVIPHIITPDFDRPKIKSSDVPNDLSIAICQHVLTFGENDIEKSTQSRMHDFLNFLIRNKLGRWQMKVVQKLSRLKEPDLLARSADGTLAENGCKSALVRNVTNKSTKNIQSEFSEPSEEEVTNLREELNMRDANKFIELLANTKVDCIPLSHTAHRIINKFGFSVFRNIATYFSTGSFKDHQPVCQVILNVGITLMIQQVSLNQWKMALNYLNIISCVSPNIMQCKVLGCDYSEVRVTVTCCNVYLENFQWKAALNLIEESQLLETLSSRNFEQDIVIKMVETFLENLTSTRNIKASITCALINKIVTSQQHFTYPINTAFYFDKLIRVSFDYSIHERLCLELYDCIIDYDQDVLLDESSYRMLFILANKSRHSLKKQIYLKSVLISIYPEVDASTNEIEIYSYWTLEEMFALVKEWFKNYVQIMATKTEIESCITVNIKQINPESDFSKASNTLKEVDWMFQGTLSRIANILSNFQPPLQYKLINENKLVLTNASVLKYVKTHIQKRSCSKY